MIPRYNGAKAEKATSGAALPAGGYVAKIESAKVEEYTWGAVLVVALDVAEGEYAGHFRKQFTDNPDVNKKWKGTYRLTIPNESSKYFAAEKRSFNNFIFALEQSNSGYIFDWDERKLKGKFFGALYRNKEFIADDGKKVTITECGGCTDIFSIRDGSFTPLKDKLLKESAVSPNTTADIIDEDDDLPFN